MKKFIQIFVCLMLMGSGFASPVCNAADSSIAAENQAYVIGLINTIRQDPLSYAESLGFNRGDLLNNFPWMADELRHGFGGCRINVDLNNRAAYLTTTSKTVAQIQNEVGVQYDYALFQEASGVVSFYNYMSVKNAYRVVLENLLRQELDPVNYGQRYLLNSRFNSVGAAAKGEKISDPNGNPYAYIVSICFASAALKSDVQMVNLINQIRQEPRDVLADLGISLGTIAQKNINAFLGIQYTKYTPFMDSTILHDLGQSDTKASRTNGWVEQFSTIPAYNGLDVSQSKAVTPHETLSSESVVNTVFSSMLDNELIVWPVEGVIFSTKAQYAGVGMGFVSGQGAFISYTTVNAGVEAVPIDTEEVGIYGLIYADEDKNGLYSPGEGKNRAPVWVYNNQGILIRRVFTDNAGHFALKLTGNQSYTLHIPNGGELISLEPFLTENLYLPVQLATPKDLLKQ